MENLEKFKIPAKINNILMGLMGIGAASLIAGFVIDSHRAWAGLLVLAYFILTIGLFGGFFISLHFLSGSKWSVVLRRVTESMIYLIPLAGIFIVVIIGFGLHDLYEWTHKSVMETDEILQKKSGYLNVPFFIVRLIGYIIIWFGVGYLINKLSLKQDKTKDPNSRGKLAALSAVFMLCFAYLLEFCSMDLIMSLEPHWQQTMYPLYVFAGLGYSGFAILILLTTTVQKFGGLKSVSAEHYHDMGKFLLAFTGFWGYIVFAQSMLIWYANMPEETIYLEKRFHGIWGGFTAFLWIGHFVIPLIILLSSKLKRTPSQLARVSWWIVFMGFVDIVWLVYGGIQEHNAHGFPFKWMEAGLFLGAIGLIGYTVLNAFSRVNPEPTGDPFYQESVHFQQKH
jgi:hypothetical protein